LGLDIQCSNVTNHFNFRSQIWQLKKIQKKLFLLSSFEKRLTLSFDENSPAKKHWENKTQKIYTPILN
jgi:hypothetical protein